MIRRCGKTRVALNTPFPAPPQAIPPRGWAVLVLFLAALLAGSTIAYAGSPRTELPILQPEARIPVAPLGYQAPDVFYMLSRATFGSLDFIDSRQLLFTFHEIRLLRRMNNDSSGEEQMIHAVVLHIPDGHVSASSDWLMGDRDRYLWPLGSGRFLVRLGESYYTTDASLKLRSLASSPTPVRMTEVSPDGRLLLVEADYQPQTPELEQKPTAQAARPEEEPPDEQVQISLVDVDTKALRAVFHVNFPILLPITSAGYLGVTQEKRNDYLLHFIPFQGKQVELGSISSSCAPHENFLSSKVLLIESCRQNKDDVYLDIWTIEGAKLWHGVRDGRLVWPTFARAENGSRFAVGVLRVSHLVNLFDSLNEEDVKQQLVQVFDTQTGALLLSTNASPILSAGQNFALSPDGSHLAVLRDGAIEIYDVPKSSESASQQVGK